MKEEISEDTLKVLNAIKEEGESIEGMETEETPIEKPVEIPKEDSEEPEVEEKEEEKPLDRDSQFVSFKKFDKIRHLNSELKQLTEQQKAKIEELSLKKEMENSDDVLIEAKAFAEKYGFEESQAKDLFASVAKIASKKANNADLEEKIAHYEAERQRMTEDRKFEAEYENVRKTYPELDSAKDDFKRLAFTEGYEKTPLQVLAAWYINEKKPKKSAEKSLKGKLTDVVDFENLSEEELSQLSDENFKKYIAYHDKKAGINL